MRHTENAISSGFRQAVPTIALLLLAGGVPLTTARVAYAQLTERLQSHFDIFPGKNNGGPYNLAWTNIEVGRDAPVEVVIDGQPLKPELFRVDAAKGQVTFVTPLSERSVARVTYRYNPNVAKTNPAVTSQPLYLPVTKFGHNAVNVIALPNSDSQKSGSVPLVFSLGGQSHFLGGGLTSELKFAGGERTGVHVGFKRGNEKNLVDAVFARNGKEFAASTGKAIGMGDAIQRRGLETRLTPAKYLATNYKLIDNVNFQTNERKAQETYALRFGDGGTKPTINLSRNDNLTVTADKKETRTYSDRLDAGTNLNKVTSVQYNRGEDTTVTPEHQETTVTKDSLDLKTKLSSVTALNLNRSGGTTIAPDKKETRVAKDVMDLKTSLDKVTSVGLNRTEDKTIAPDNSETRVKTDKFDVAKRLDKMTSVTATTLQAITDGSTEAVEALAKGAVVTLTSAANGGAKQATATVNTGSRQSKTALEINRSMVVRLQPAPVFVVSASQSEQRVTPVAANGSTGTTSTVLTQTATAEIVPVPGTKMTSAIAETTSNDVKVSSTNFGAEVGTGKNVEIKANVINRSSEAPGNSPLDTTQTQVALRPLRNILLTGVYTWNPVDPANGSVRQALRQEFAITAKMGALEVGSGYAITTVNGMTKTDCPDPQYGTVSVTLGLRFSRFTHFNGTFNDSLHYHSVEEVIPNQLPKYLRNLTVALTHDIGSAFNVTLGGSRIDDRSRAKLPTDIKAEARVAVRF